MDILKIVNYYQLISNYWHVHEKPAIVYMLKIMMRYYSNILFREFDDLLYIINNDSSIYYDLLLRLYLKHKID